MVCILSCGVLHTQEPRRHDVVIHELFPDPSPVIGLPASEFIELRNVSSVPFNLRNWKVTDGSSTATISSNFILQPDSMVIICPSTSVAAFAAFGNAIGVTAFPSLNNDRDLISLVSPAGSVIHSVEYELAWYGNAVKSEGGWTLEMIDPDNPCTGKGNWRAGNDPAGGTPGRRNSIERSNADLQPPALLRTYTTDSVTIVALFDESLDSVSAAAVSNYTMDHGLTVARASPVLPGFREVSLALSAPMLRENIYTLQVSGITDCKGNSVGIMNTARTGLPSAPDTMDMVINEIMFNPPAAGTDYVEFYNNSRKIFDASLLFCASWNTLGVIAAPRKLSEVPFLVFPGDHIVVTADASLVQMLYTVPYPLNLITAAQLPSLPDDEGNIVLLDQQGMAIDELSYDEKWHFPLIVHREGIALERIDPHLPTQQRENWTSAASDAGYGTPTARNSQFRTHQFSQGTVRAASPVFSPDGDGREDLCFIEYQFAAPNNVATVTIFDVNGVSVKNLYHSVTLSEKGVFRWDGLDERGRKSPPGLYIILVSVFNLEGRRKNFKNVVTLARG